METDTESTLQEYQIQLEQVELALKSKPDNEELLKLKEDLVEVITLTKELIEEERAQSSRKETATSGSGGAVGNCKSGDKVMAIWRVDGKYYSATINQIFEDGTCTVIFDGYSTVELTQVNQLKPRTKTSTPIFSNEATNPIKAPSMGQAGQGVGNKKAFTKKELEQKLKEARKRKKEKFAQKLKAMEELSEKEKNKWKNFNTKLSSKTWKGVVKKNKFDLPADHENKVGVGTNSLTYRSGGSSGGGGSGGNASTTNANSSAHASASVLSQSSKAKSSSSSSSSSSHRHHRS